MKHPYKGKYIITQTYMNKSDFYTSGYHFGIDLVGLDDKRIFAIENGTVDNISTNDGYGNSVVVKRADGLYDRYSHLAEIHVKVGQLVQEGETQIGVEGDTGKVRGWGDPRHLDLRITKLPYHSNNTYDYLSPAEYLKIPNTEDYIVTPKEEEKMVRPSGGNISLMNGEVGWIETLPDRVIIHYDEYTYMCIWDGKITLHAKGKNTVQLI